MHPNPTLIPFILHRKSFWLGVFTMLFLAWAWHDSEYHRNHFYYGNSKYMITVDSRDGGCSFYAGSTDPGSPSGFFIEREQKYLPPSTPIRLSGGVYRMSIRKIICYGPPDIHYLTLMIMVLLTTTAWLTWGWHKTVAALSKCHAEI
jgi:hypothetical protein